MPLILLTGYPSSGKTHRAQQLITALTEKIFTSTNPHHGRLSIVHINDQSLGVSRDVYGDPRKEKDARAAETSAVKRALGRDVLVVVDGLNYIKGFRYQLYCEAKALGTTNCVVHIGTPIPTCRETNAQLLSDGTGGYINEIFENLVFRYEEPNGMTRWDSPLFTVLWDDDAPPTDSIWDALIGSDGKGKVVRPNAATVLAPPTDSDYLYNLDKTTQAILKRVTDYQGDHMGEMGGEITIAEGVITLPAAPLSLSQLQRLRRQYITLSRAHKLPKERTGESFVAFLNAEWGIGNG